MPKRKAAIRGLAGIEQQEVQLAEGEAQLRPKSQLEHCRHSMSRHKLQAHIPRRPGGSGSTGFRFIQEQVDSPGSPTGK